MSDDYKWTTLSSEEVDRNKFWTHRKDAFRTPRGREGQYDYTVHSDAVGIVGQLADGRFVMIEEYRYLFDRLSLALAQGGMEEGEDPETAARREFEEETGYRAGTIVSLGWFGSAPAFSKERTHVFYASDLTKVEALDNEEIERVLLMTKEEVEAAIVSGEMWDSHSITPWQMAQAYLAKSAKKD